MNALLGLWPWPRTRLAMEKPLVGAFSGSVAGAESAQCPELSSGAVSRSGEKAV